MMEEPKEQSQRDVEGRDSESAGDEREGLISGIRTAGFRNTAARKQSIIISRLMLLLLLVSIGFNIIQLVYVNVHKPQAYSLYAKLPEHEKTIPFWYATEYSEGHEDEKEALWNSIDISEGFVAISHEESDALGLPRSKTFPWDANKGIYVSHGHHALHCVTLLHAYTHDAHAGKKPVVSYHHIEHCLDLLRQDVMCYADDNMDYTKDHGEQFLTGDNQPKKCRDWNKLSEWVQQRSACYRTINITRAGEDHGVAHQLDRYTYCPKGSPYVPLIEAWRDLNRQNKGNLDPVALENASEEERKADAEAVAKHNADITKSDRDQPLW